MRSSREVDLSQPGAQAFVPRAGLRLTAPRRGDGHFLPENRTRRLYKAAMAKSVKTVGLSYGVLRKECLEAVRHWPGCETVAGIQIIRDNTPGGFSVRVTLYGKADERIADRAISCVQREKRRQFHLTE